ASYSEPDTNLPPPFEKENNAITENIESKPSLPIKNQGNPLVLMTKSTRSNRPELQGLLEAPTRPRGRKSASEQGGGVQYVNSSREISGDPNQRRSPSDPNTKLAHTLLDSLDAVNLNINTLDLNSKINLKTLPPLPLAYAMTNKHSEIIVSVSQDMKALKENEEENRTNSQEIVREIKELKLSLINNSDNIISSLREDAIIEKQQQNSFLEEFKKIMINQNKNMSNNFNAQISALNNKVTALNNKIEQISNSSPPKEEPLPNPWSQRVEQSPRITAHNSQVRERPPHLQSSTSRYNNPFMQDNQIKAATQPALITTPTWFALKSEAVRKQPWSIWRQLIKARFSTRIWKTAKHLALDNDYFDPTQHSVYECCLIQKKRVDCVLDNLTLEETNDRLLT
ncbi:hypothetical protein MJO29_008541, partial [Puccinia striiformis f. sp. tritici]